MTARAATDPLAHERTPRSRPLRFGGEFLLYVVALALAPALFGLLRAPGGMAAFDPQWRMWSLRIGAWNLLHALPIAVAWFVALQSNRRSRWIAARVAAVAVLVFALGSCWDAYADLEGLGWWPMGVIGHVVPFGLVFAVLALLAAGLYEGIKPRAESVDARPIPHAPHRRRSRPLP